ncbi:MAG: DUF2934 domain-containing protein [Nitrospira sp.]|nr:DUF2934 domain-containing protein [Nitrospira sp.]
MTSKKSGSGAGAKKTKVAITSGSEKARPTARDLQPSANVDGLHERIAARAYALHEERGYRNGCDLQDWLDAEREIMSRELRT